MKKYLSAIFALLLASALAVTAILPAIAADDEAEEKVFPDYTSLIYATEADKIATMDKKLDMNGYELYIQPETAEVAVVNKTTGQTLFTNPYDVAASKGTETTKNKLLSQLIINYTENGTAKEYNSYNDAAKLGQVIIKDIKNGVRVEYTIGRANANYLVPRMISVDRLREEILNFIDDPATPKIENNFHYQKIVSFYDLKDPGDPTLPQSLKDEMYKTYPITKNKPIYVLTADINNRELAMMENIIKTYAPDYTYEEMEFDHMDTGYEAKTLSTPVFRMSLEYTIEEDGLEVTLPANGIRFDETLYTLEGITFLPYMGAGTYTNEGYTFIPDGSGTIMNYSENAGKNTSIGAKIYGTDYAYQTIDGAANQDIMRMPVYGTVETRKVTKYVEKEETVVDTIVTTDPETGEETVIEVESVQTVSEPVKGTESRGFFAIIEEGDALTKITAKHENQLNSYNAVQLTFSPRSKDSYILSDSISVGSNSAITITSSRKYVDSYKVKYFILTDPAIAEEKGIEKFYETSWLGMAKAYRDYLTANGTLTRLTENDVKKDIPLYIESFGVTQTVEKVLSIPTEVDKALTTFEDVRKMYDELASEGITNIDFKLTGFSNGGMYPTVPYKLKWEKAAGGASEYEKLLAYANEKGFGIYPDFDFAYATNDKTFDGLTLGKHIVKTIDDRYASLREYDASLQEYVSYYTLCISPSVYTEFYTNFAKSYLKQNTAISVSSMGKTLNSDFDEKDPYNRNDAKQFIVDFFKGLDSDMTSVMTEGGNAFTWQYSDKILGVSLQSSRSLYSSASVPFMGVVLHGSVQFAGNPLNTAGDIDYEVLKAIENGTGVYFTLSCDNTELLKEDFKLSKYYSVRYDIWHDELIERYNELNGLLADLQTSLIVGHEFLDGSRVATEDELAADAAASAARIAERTESAAQKAKQDALAELRAQYLEGKIGAGLREVTVTDEEGNTKTLTLDPVITDIVDEGNAAKYASDRESIVLVTYENGTRFILNYNNFDITTVVDDVTYTVGTYGYVVIK